MYYTFGPRNARFTPPLPVRLFFISNEDDLVLMDITGGGLGTAEKKMRAMNAWIAEHKDEVPQYQL
jgi:hypothetical protein